MRLPKKNMLNLTQNLDNNVDHIILISNFLKDKLISVTTFNLEKN